MVKTEPLPTMEEV